MDHKNILLLVEDDKMLRTALVEKLTHEGFVVSEASDGQEGLQKSLSLRPDLILLDLLMPIMNGTVMLDNLRQHEWGKTVPVIILTNHDADDHIIQNVVANQPAYYCIKANTPLEELVEKVKVVLEDPVPVQ
jgi:DNA-binding response OmpR family regulator